MFNCSCCGTEVTSPYFYDGGVYGYTCIKKVNPNTKRNKPKSKAVEVEVLSIVWRNPDSNLDGTGQAIISVNGEKSRVPCSKKISEDHSHYINKIEHIGNFAFYNDKWWSIVK